jgi:hypothetical protein
MAGRAPDSAIGEAIDRVLASERDAAGAIEAARRDAEARLEAARAERRRLLERARLRETRLHGAAERRLERALALLGDAATAPGNDPGPLDELMTEAVARVARRLTAPAHERD